MHPEDAFRIFSTQSYASAVKQGERQLLSIMTNVGVSVCNLLVSESKFYNQFLTSRAQKSLFSTV